MLHAVYRVGDLPSTRKFLETLGMHVLRERDVAQEKYTNVFYGFGTESKGQFFSLELTYNYGVEDYDVGSGLGYFAVAVPDVDSIVQDVEKQGFHVAEREGVDNEEKYALVEDPTGYSFKVIERTQKDPLCQIMLRVGDIGKSVKFYEALGMQLLREEKSSASDTLTSAVLGYGSSETECTVVQLVSEYDASKRTSGDGYAQIAVSTPDVYKAAQALRDAGIAIAREPGPVPGIGTKICAVRDPDNWKVVLVDEADFESEL